MNPLSRLSLRALLTAPYVALVVTLAIVIGALSFRAGRDAVDNLSGQLLIETVNRIAQAVERHVAGSAAVLEAAFPAGTVAPDLSTGQFGELRTRFWLATSVHRDPNNYAYFGDRHGRFFGLWRSSESQAELRLRLQGSGPRQIHPFTGIDGVLGPATVETRIFDPRERPWYKAGQQSPQPTWTSIYIDFKTQELIATRARRVNNRSGEFEGVVATDLSLRRVNAFLQQLGLSTNGVAMVVENDGRLIGVSRGSNLRPGPDGQPARLNAADSTEPLVAESYAAVRKLIDSKQDAEPHTGVFQSAAGEAVQVGYAQLHDEAGLDWLIVVAVPRQDFLQRVVENFRTTVALAVLASLAVIAIGLLVLATVTRELRQLALAAKRFGDGEPGPTLEITRRDELGDLARSFEQMQTRLLTDKLTGLSNRDAVLRRVEERIQQQRRRGDLRPFVVAFVDFNRFKSINDRFGHDVGDKVLQELAVRLRVNVRSVDMVARYAGDEFVVMIDSVENRRDAEAVRAHLDSALRRPLLSLAKLAPQAANDGAAIGIALYPEDGQDVDTLIKQADKDMYARKGDAPPAA